MTTDQKTTGRRELVGRVISDKMNKTVTVQVVRRVKHPTYEKFVQRQKTYKAHDENNECRVDDEVVIQETRPMSRTKRWTVIERRPAK